MNKRSARDYRFGATIGEGSYSTVYSAVDLHNNKTFAIKVLSKRHIVKEDKIKYVNIEKTTLHRLGLQHPGIVQLYYTFQDDSSLFFVLDFAEYGELLSIIRKFGSLSESVSHFYMCQLIDAVKFIHSKGVIHRDLKPENILVGYDFNLKITDFGAAKLLGEKSDLNEETVDYNGISRDLNQEQKERKASFVGTAEYVPPELLKDNICGFETDIWAIGCILYQFFYGNPPFKGQTEYLTFEKIINVNYSFKPNLPLPSDVVSIIEQVLKADPSKRLTLPQIQSSNWFKNVQWHDPTYIWGRKVPRFEPYDPHASPYSYSKNGNGRMHESNSQQQLQAQIQNSDFTLIPTAGKKAYQPATKIKMGVGYSPNQNTVKPLNTSPPKGLAIQAPTMMTPNGGTGIPMKQAANAKMPLNIPSAMPITQITQQAMMQQYQGQQRVPQQQQQTPPQLQQQQQQQQNRPTPPAKQFSSDVNGSSRGTPMAQTRSQSQSSIAASPQSMPRTASSTAISTPISNVNYSPQATRSPPSSSQLPTVKTMPSPSQPLSQASFGSKSSTNIYKMIANGQTNLSPYNLMQKTPSSNTVNASTAAAMANLKLEQAKEKQTQAHTQPQAQGYSQIQAQTQTQTQAVAPSAKTNTASIKFKEVSGLLFSGEKILKLDVILKSQLDKRYRANHKLTDSFIETLIQKHQKLLDSSSKPVVTIITNMARVFFIDGQLNVMLIDLKANQGGDYSMYDYEFESIAVSDEEDDNAGQEMYGYLILELIREGGDLIFLKRIEDPSKVEMVTVVDKNGKTVKLGSDYGWIDCLLIAKDMVEKAPEKKPASKEPKKDTNTDKRKEREKPKPKPKPTRDASKDKNNMKDIKGFAHAAAAAAHKH